MRHNTQREVNFTMTYSSINVVHQPTRIHLQRTKTYNVKTKDLIRDTILMKIFDKKLKIIKIVKIYTSKI